MLQENQDSDPSISGKYIFFRFLIQFQLIRFHHLSQQLHFYPADQQHVYQNPFINPRISIHPTNTKDKVPISVMQNVDNDFFPSSSKSVIGSVSDEDNISDAEGFQVEPSFDLMRKSNDCVNIKSNLHDFESVKQEETSMWSSVFEETKELIRLNKNGSRSSTLPANNEAKKNWKGSRSKSKPTFSFGIYPDREASRSLTAMDKIENSTEIHQDIEGLEELEHGPKEHSMTELLEGLQKDYTKQSESELSTSGQRNIEHPVAELLECLLQNHGSLRETPKMLLQNKEIKGKRPAVTSKRTRASLACRNLDKGDPSEPLDSSTSSDEEEDAKLQLQDNDEKQLKIMAPELNGQTMADRFQEALNAAATKDQGMLFGTSKQTCIGYYGRLQQVMQAEKERHVEFLNQSQGKISRDEVSSIDVKILSRYLDAKLTVCDCSLAETIKTPPTFLDNKEKRTIIFSSRICSNVELEVGNLVRIHPPWKEVEVENKDMGIILCTYFSQIST